MRVTGAIFHRSKHLNEEQLCPKDSSCGFCGCTERRVVSQLQEEPGIELLKCSLCGASSASRMPTDQALADYYGEYYVALEAPNSGERVTFDDCERFGAYLATKARGHIDPKEIRVLDFGGGDGSISRLMAHKLLEHGAERVEVTVVDYNDNTVPADDERIRLERRATLAEVEATFQIVVASAIIEHLPRPRAVMNGLMERLEPGGIFYARTPYVVPLLRLLRFLGIPLDFTFPGHVHDLGQDFWEKYFEEIHDGDPVEIIESRPSMVETTFGRHFARTLAAHVLKAPWWVFGRRWRLVGGWEIVVRKLPAR